jgi:hypothetical protein
MISTLWSKEDDEILKQQVRIHGIPKWKHVSKAFKNKTSRQCRHRWFNYFCCDVNKTDWSVEEDALLLQSQQKWGNKWTKVTKID